MVTTDSLQLRGWDSNTGTSLPPELNRCAKQAMISSSSMTRMVMARQNIPT
jgi:hypothetical protein